MESIINLTDFLTVNARIFSNKTALICGKKRLKYQEINEQTDRLAGYLCKIGVKRGDRVVVSFGNTAETVITFWACLKANAIVSIINPEQSAEKIAAIMKDSGAKILLTLHANPILESLQSYTKEPIKIIYHEDFDEILAKSDQLVRPVCKILDIDLASIIYTSGSTGEPKGVMMTHRNMITAAQSLNTYLKNDTSDIFLSVLPISFDYGLYQMIMAFSVGATLILEKNFLLPSKTMQIIAGEKVTALPCVPSMVSLFSDFSEIANYDLSSIRYVTNTGAAISENQISVIQKIFPNAEFFSMYGLTECKRCTYLPPKDLKRKVNSVGIAIPNTEMWVVDHDNNILGPNQIGQLVIRGGTVMQGYWNKPEQTEKKLKPGLLPNEKILYTGDLVSIDEEGYLYFKGRMDEIIKCRGMKVSPKEIEDVVMTLGYVKETAAVGIPDENLGEAIHLFVAVENDDGKITEEILAICKEHLEAYKLPTKVIIKSHLPKTKNGKIDKQALISELEMIPCEQYEEGE